MSGILSGFTFNGLHCMRDFGLLYVPSEEGRVITPARRVNAYEIAGTSGTVRFPGETYGVSTLAGALYPMESPADDKAAQALMRRVAPWLYGPRGQLIFDYEPDRYLVAEVVAESIWSDQSWLDGGLDFTFEIQPFAYAVAPVVHRHVMDEGGGYFAMEVETGLPAPLEAVITNAGSSALTGVRIECGGAVWDFSGMELAAGATLTISGETPIGAEITESGVVTNALVYADTFDQVALQGAQRVQVSLTFSGGSGSAAVELRARGRWL